jgi:hypothetical protein
MPRHIPTVAIVFFLTNMPAAGEQRGFLDRVSNGSPTCAENWQRLGA